MPRFRVTRQRNLALMILGILQIRDAHLTVSEIARSVPGRSDHWHKFKRIWRFVSSVKWSPAQHFGDLLAFVLARFRVGKYLPIIVDQSTVGGKYEVLWASIPYRSRALPIAIRVFRHQDIRHTDDSSQNLIEEEFVRQVLDMLPAIVRPLLLFDRGYARVSLMQLLDSLGAFYVIRVRRGTWVRWRKHLGPLSELPIRPGQLRWLPRARYQQHEQYRVNLAVTRNATAEEPWYLATNLRRSDTAVRWYERRFRCEEEFRDIKDQLHLETIRVTTVQRVERLLFGLMLTYYALTLIGVAAHRAGLSRKVCKDKISVAWMALRLLKMPAILKPRMLRQALMAYCWSMSYESG
jgi:hypothetical protein